MFIYIGNDYVVESKKIIAIFDMELVRQSKRLTSIVKTKEKDKQLYGSKNDAKSIILTEDAIYLSPLSTLTLKNRDELYQTIS